MELKKSKWFLAKYIFIGILLIPALFYGVFIIIWAILRYNIDVIKIENNQLYSRMGLFNIDIKTIPLNKISMVSVKANLLNQILGYGTIEIQSSANDSSITYPFIKRASKIVYEINKRIK